MRSMGMSTIELQNLRNMGNCRSKKLEDLELGSRIEISEEKEHPVDFAFEDTKPGSLAGTAPGDQADRVGILNAQLWRKRYLGENHRYTWGGQDLIFPP